MSILLLIWLEKWWNILKDNLKNHRKPLKTRSAFVSNVGAAIFFLSENRSGLLMRVRLYSTNAEIATINGETDHATDFRSKSATIPNNIRRFRLLRYDSSIKWVFFIHLKWSRHTWFSSLIPRGSLIWHQTTSFRLAHLDGSIRTSTWADLGWGVFFLIRKFFTEPKHWHHYTNRWHYHVWYYFLPDHHQAVLIKKMGQRTRGCSPFVLLFLINHTHSDAGNTQWTCRLCENDVKTIRRL